MRGSHEKDISTVETTAAAAIWVLEADPHEERARRSAQPSAQRTQTAFAGLIWMDATHLRSASDFSEVSNSGAFTNKAAKSRAGSWWSTCGKLHPRIEPSES